MYRAIFIILLFSWNLSAQERPTLAKGEVKKIYGDVEFLASPELMGRAPGSEGIGMAREYILRNFQEEEIQGAFREGYLQDFMIPSQVAVDTVNTGFRYNKDGFLRREHNLKLKQDFFPVRYSTNGAVEGKTHFVGFGIESEALGRDDIDDKKVLGKVAVMDVGSPDGIHPHSAYLEWHDLKKRLQLLADKGVLGVILVNRSGRANPPQSDYKTLSSCGLPVVFVRNEKYARKLSGRRSRPVAFSVFQEEVPLRAFNVAGYINNQAEHTIIIGAHYDHLGMGKEGSRYTGSEPQVHPGADDNASGVAGLLALARYLPKTDNEKIRQFNYLLVAFSAEEMGLLGSKYFAENMYQELSHEYLYMLNMDMIGRMENLMLMVNGVGTSSAWGDIFAMTESGLHLETTESGVGPSDHTSFYYKDIPVLHFFTGTHSDYHKPTDIAEKIDAVGIYHTVNFILNILEASAGMNFPFTPTKQESSKAPQFSVTLGVMPDYLYRGEGMKIDGVSEGKPAAAAGLREGDIVKQIGKVQVRDMQSYMKALGQFKKGQEADLLYERKGKMQRTKVKF